MHIKEPNMPGGGTLYIYDHRNTIDEHIAKKYAPARVCKNIIPTVGRVYILSDDSGIHDINYMALGDDATTHTIGSTGLNSEQFRAQLTDYRVTGTIRFMELFLTSAEANFTIRELGLFADAGAGAGTGTPLSLLVVSPEYEKTTAKTPTFIVEYGWS